LHILTIAEGMEDQFGFVVMLWSGSV